MDEVLESIVIGKGSSKNKKQELTANDSSDNEILPKNPLLYLFVQYAWDPRHGPCYNGHEYKKLECLLETVESSRGDTLDYRDSENRLCFLRKPSNATYDEDFQRRTQDEKDIEILAHVAYKLKRVIYFLNQSKGDVNYQNGWGETVLHRFLHECLEIPVDVPEDQICRIRKVIENLMEMKAPLYVVNYEGQTPFHIATLCENRQILQIMISSLTDVEGHDEFGNTVLHVVVDNCVNKEGNHKDGYIDLVRTLVSKGANINAKNSDSATPVHLAAGKFQADMLRLFADEGANFNECTNDDQTPIQIACKSKLKLKDSSKVMETFDFLVAEGCDLAVFDSEGHTLLHLAAEFQIVEIVERLITLGANVDCRTKKTLLTPLYLAAKRDKLDNMQALVRAGADVNAEAADGSTPIFIIAMRGSYESMQFLMDQGADLHRRDNLMGFTLLHMAANGMKLRPDFKAPAGTRTEGEFKKLKMLIDKGLDVNDAGICGVTPLQLVVLSGNVDAVTLLLDRGAKVDLHASQWTALHVAVMMHYLEVVKILLARGADVHRREGTGHWSPIHLAVMDRCFAMGWYPDAVQTDDVRLSCPIKQLWVYKGRSREALHREFTTLLIDHGADVNVQNAFGETPLHVVNPHEDDVMKKLLDAGAHVNVQDRTCRLPLHNNCNNNHFCGTNAFEMLLDFGADINDDDTSELIMSSKKEIKDIAIQHAIKLNLVGLPIAKVYEPFIDAPELADFHEKCFKEATDLMNHCDADGFSLYEFLRINPKFQYHYIDKISNSYRNLDKLFPIYANVIRGACRESAIRRQLLKPARIAWAENTGVHLPDVCVEHILSYLSNRHLKVMATTFEKITNIEDERITFIIGCASKMSNAGYPLPLHYTYFRTGVHIRYL